MKNTRIFLLTAMIVMPLTGTAGTWNRPTTATSPAFTIPPTPTGRPTTNLIGKMFTLSKRGGVTLYPPHYSTPPSFTSAKTERTTSAPTTPPLTPGWSVCLRFLTDSIYYELFTVCPFSCYSVKLKIESPTTFQLRQGYEESVLVNFVPNIKYMSESAADMWTSVCITVDTNNVTQLFRGSNMSIRKILPFRCSLKGQPTIELQQFEGQVTDFQMWDYPLHNKEVVNYMNYGLYRGSILTWYDISYSANGNVLLEDVYDFRAKQPVSRREKGRRRIKGGIETKKASIQEGNRL